MIKDGIDVVSTCTIFISCFVLLLVPASLINYLWYRYRGKPK